MNERRRDLHNADAAIDTEPQAAERQQQQQPSSSSTLFSNSTKASPLAIAHTQAGGLIPAIGGGGAHSTSANALAVPTTANCNNSVALSESSGEPAGDQHSSSPRVLLGFSTLSPPTVTTDSIRLKRNAPTESIATVSGGDDDEAARQKATNANNVNDSERRYRPQKVCAVCGDRAIACNFNAVTCESCKAFFRRNAFKEQRLKCLFDNRCIIDRATRRFCSKCRLLKCFQIGMKREWILTDEQKQIKRVKILQNKQSRNQVPFSTTSSPTTLSGGADSSPLVSKQQLSPTYSERFKPDPCNASIGSSSNSRVCNEAATASSCSSGSQITGEAGRTTKRLRTSQKMEQNSSFGSRIVQYKDASTSCPDELDLLDPNFRGMHYCAFASQCQYCSLRLDGHCATSASYRIQQQQQPSAEHCAQLNHHYRNHQQQQQEHHYSHQQEHYHQHHHQHEQCKQVVGRLPTYMSPAISTSTATNGLSRHHHQSHLATGAGSPGTYGDPVAAAISSALSPQVQACQAIAVDQQRVASSQADLCCLGATQAYSQTPTSTTTTVINHFASRVAPSQIIQFPAAVGQRISQLHVMTPSPHLVNSPANLPASAAAATVAVAAGSHNDQPMMTVTCPSQNVLNQSNPVVDSGLWVASSTTTSVRACPTSSHLAGWLTAAVGCELVRQPICTTSGCNQASQSLTNDITNETGIEASAAIGTFRYAQVAACPLDANGNGNCNDSQAASCGGGNDDGVEARSVFERCLKAKNPEEFDKDGDDNNSKESHSSSSAPMKNTSSTRTSNKALNENILNSKPVNNSETMISMNNMLTHHSSSATAQVLGRKQPGGSSSSSQEHPLGAELSAVIPTKKEGKQNNDDEDEDDDQEEEYDFDLYNYCIDGNGTNPGNEGTEDIVGGQEGNNGMKKKKKKFVGLPPFVYWENHAYAMPVQKEIELWERLKLLEFTENEVKIIGELIEGTKFLFEQPSERDFQVELNDIVAFCDIALRRLIKTVKQIKTFRMLSMDDQIMLLKAACFKILLLRSSFHYNDQIGGWYDARTGRVVHLDILKQAKKSLVYEKHFDMLKKVPEPLRKDRFIMAILALALLFEPSSALKHSNSVELDNLIYLCILRKYLLQTQPDPLSKYQSLILALQLINDCNDAYNVFFAKDLEPEHIPPLLMEIFDISINNKTEE